MRQQRLKAFPGATVAGVIAAKFFEQFLVSVNIAETLADMGFGWESAAPLTAGLERKRVVLRVWYA